MYKSLRQKFLYFFAKDKRLKGQNGLNWNHTSSSRYIVWFLIQNLIKWCFSGILIKELISLHWCFNSCHLKIGLNQFYNVGTDGNHSEALIRVWSFKNEFISLIIIQKMHKKSINSIWITYFSLWFWGFGIHSKVFLLYPVSQFFCEIFVVSFLLKYCAVFKKITDQNP